MRNFLLTLVIFCCSTQMFAQQVMSPEAFLGYEVGSRFTRHHRAVEYFKYVAEKLPNAKWVKYGETYENRELGLLFISSQKNFDNLEEIRTNNLKTTGLMEGTPSNSKAGIVWLSYNVHGNESVSMEAAMKTLYEFANSSNSKTQEWLENTVLIMDPCINPDGRDRYANFYNQYGNQVPNPDINSMEHHEPWPGGRANHYLFDLNRDWAWTTQVESQQRLKVYNQWMPHVHVDFHEQGINSPYYFAPAAKPYHENITKWQSEFQEIIGKNHAKYFDENNWLYFTDEVFDLLYPSYGDSYPTFNGAIGMTYEQGGSGRAGLTVYTEFGDELTLYDRIAHHHSNGLSTVEAASVNNKRMLEEFETFFKNGPINKKYKSFVIKGTNKKEKLDQLARFLSSHQIKFSQGASSKKALSGNDYEGRKNASFSVNSEDLIISIRQPKGNLVSILFEPETHLQDSLTYDITAWSLPYVYGLEAYAVSEDLSGNKEYNMASEVALNIDPLAYAYIADYGHFKDAQFLAFLQNNGVAVRATSKPISIEGKTFNRGALIITKRNNEILGEDLVEIIKEGAETYNRNVVSLKTGWADRGSDLGSGSISYLAAPKVALLGGDGASSLAFGQVWYFMEQELGYPVTTIGTEYFMSVNLSSYDVLIIPSGRYSVLDKEGLEKVSTWVNEGGKLIVMDRALNQFADKEGFGLSRFSNSEEKKKEDTTKPQISNYEAEERIQLSQSISGAIFKVNMDPTHPLAYGYDSEYFSLKSGAMKFAYLKNGWNVGILPAKPKPLNGFAGYKALENISETLVFGVEQKGRGSVVYFVDDPLFRAFWENGKLLFSNALFMVGQ